MRVLPITQGADVLGKYEVHMQNHKPFAPMFLQPHVHSCWWCTLNCEENYFVIHPSLWHALKSHKLFS